MAEDMSASRLSLDGMCSDNPRAWNDERRGVLGLRMAVSSFDTRRKGSRKAGEGDSIGLGASESDLGLGEPLSEVLRERGVRSPSCCSICWVKFDLLEVGVLSGCKAMMEADMLRRLEECSLCSGVVWCAIATKKHTSLVETCRNS